MVQARRGGRPVAVAVTALVAASIPPAVRAAPAAGPVAYPCRIYGTTDGRVIHGLFGDAGVIGWEGNHDSVITCLGGSFYLRDGYSAPRPIFGFGVYNESPTRWSNAGGYLPALVTRFHSGHAEVSITNFADRDVVEHRAYVVVYSRVRVHNPTAHSVSVDPAATPGLHRLNKASNTVPAGGTVDHDFVIAADRFGGSYDWPSGAALVDAGGYDRHFAHMRAYWNRRLAGIATPTALPDHRLVNAYKAGFIYTQIIKDGTHLNTGPDNYNKEFSHDVIGILTNLFTQGDFAHAHALLLRARHVIGSERMYDDGVWTFSWPWAEYLMKTGDLRFVRAHFAKNGPRGAADPSIRNAAHQIATDRTGPGGIMRATGDIDSNGYWTIDDYSALFGLATYRYVARRLGATHEARWATAQYASLLRATNRRLKKTVTQNHLHYIPCSILGPNDGNRCKKPQDANWAAPFNSGRWGWDGYLFGAHQSGPALHLIDPTYRYGFERLRGVLPRDTFGGYPEMYYYSTGYNAGYGSWGLRGRHYRDQGIHSYEFMLDNTQGGPLSWWESTNSVKTGNPWLGSHPVNGKGSCPHAWGMANANKVLLDSIAAQRSDGQLIVGRGIPRSWVRNGKTIALRNFPTMAGHRVGVRIRAHGRSVRLRITGRPSGPVLFELPAFVDNITSVSNGRYDERTGVVRLAATARSVRVVLDRAQRGRARRAMS
jgi:hypothetical protein